MIMNRREGNSTNSSNVGTTPKSRQTTQPAWRNTTKYNHQQTKPDTISSSTPKRTPAPTQVKPIVTPSPRLTLTSTSSTPKSNVTGGPNSVNKRPPFFVSTPRRAQPAIPPRLTPEKRATVQRSVPGKSARRGEKLPASTLNVILPPHAGKSKTESSVDSQMFPRHAALTENSHRRTSEFTAYNVQIESSIDNANVFQELLPDKPEEKEEQQVTVDEPDESKNLTLIPTLSSVHEEPQNVEEKIEEIIISPPSKDELVILTEPIVLNDTEKPVMVQEPEVNLPEVSLSQEHHVQEMNHEEDSGVTEEKNLVVENEISQEICFVSSPIFIAKDNSEPVQESGSINENTKLATVYEDEDEIEDENSKEIEEENLKETEDNNLEETEIKTPEMEAPAPGVELIEENLAINSSDIVVESESQVEISQENEDEDDEEDSSPPPEVNEQEDANSISNPNANDCEAKKSSNTLTNVDNLDPINLILEQGAMRKTGSAKKRNMFSI